MRMTGRTRHLIHLSSLLNRNGRWWTSVRNSAESDEEHVFHAVVPATLLGEKFLANYIDWPVGAQDEVVKKYNNA